MNDLAKEDYDKYCAVVSGLRTYVGRLSRDGNASSIVDDIVVFMYNHGFHDFEKMMVFVVQEAPELFDAIAHDEFEEAWDKVCFFHYDDKNKIYDSVDYDSIVAARSKPEPDDVVGYDQVRSALGDRYCMRYLWEVLGRMGFTKVTSERSETHIKCYAMALRSILNQYYDGEYCIQPGDEPCDTGYNIGYSGLELDDLVFGQIYGRYCGEKSYKFEDERYDMALAVAHALIPEVIVSLSQVFTVEEIDWLFYGEPFDYSRFAICKEFDPNIDKGNPADYFDYRVYVEHSELGCSSSDRDRIYDYSPWSSDGYNHEQAFNLLLELWKSADSANGCSVIIRDDNDAEK